MWCHVQQQHLGKKPNFTKFFLVSAEKPEDVENKHIEIYQVLNERNLHQEY